MEITEKLLFIIDVLYVLSDLYLAIREELESLNRERGPSTKGWQKLGRMFISFLRGLKRMGSRVFKVFDRKSRRNKTSTHNDDDDGDNMGAYPAVLTSQ